MRDVLVHQKGVPRRPFHMLAFDCRCSTRHFNSGECIICILDERPRFENHRPESNTNKNKASSYKPKRRAFIEINENVPLRFINRNFIFVLICT